MASGVTSTAVPARVRRGARGGATRVALAPRVVFAPAGTGAVVLILA